MPIYNYKAVDKYGVVKEGSISAASETEVADSLKAQDLTIIKIGLSGEEWSGIKFLRGRRISSLEMVNFMDNLATMIRSGLTLLDAITVIKEDTRNPRLKEILTSLEYNLQSGIPLSETLLKYPDAFDSSMVSLIKAGELSGRLDEALENLAFKLKQDFELSRNLKSTLAYPGVVFAILILMASFITIFILPRLADAFSRLSTTLPIGIRLIITAGNILKHYYYLIILGLLLIFWLIFKFFKSAYGKKLTNRTVMRLPWLREIALYIDLARYSFSLSILLKSGVPITESLHIAAAAIYNDELREATLQFEREVTSGLTLSQALSKTSYRFPAFIKQMVDTGERTGHLDESFLKLGNFYREEVNVRLKTFTSIIEPILMVIIGLLVALFIITILAPIYRIIGTFQVR